MEMTQMNTRIPVDLKREGDQVAARAGKTPSDIVRAVWAYMRDKQRVPEFALTREKNNDDGAQPRVFERRDEIMNAFFAQTGLTAESLCGQSYEQLREEMAAEMLAEYEALDD